MTTLEQLDAVIAELAEEGQLTADVNSMGPADTGYSVDDDSSCRVRLVTEADVFCSAVHPRLTTFHLPPFLSDMA